MNEQQSETTELARTMSLKYKPDFTAPLIPAMCLILGITNMNSHCDSWAELITARLLAMLVIYSGMFNIINTIQRNHHSRKDS